MPDPTPLETVTIEGKEYEVSGYAADGLPIVKGIVTSVHHTDDDGNLLFDEDGNPKRSVHISVSPASEPITETEKE